MSKHLFRLGYKHTLWHHQDRKDGRATEKQKTKKAALFKSSFDKELKDLDAKWSELLSRIEVMLVA